MSNSQNLENAVLTSSPQEVAALCGRLGAEENSCRALGLACRFRGLEYVKALVENGANFRYIRPEGQGGYFTINYWLSPLEMNGALRKAYFVNSDPCFSNVMTLTDIRHAAVKTLKVLPIEERAEIVRYLCKNRERIKLDAGELLFYSTMSGSKKITAVLKEQGAEFSEKRIKELTESGRSFEWQEYCLMSEFLGDKEFLETMRSIIAEVGGKTLRYTDAIYWGNYNPNRDQFRLFEPEFFKFILDSFDQKKMNKGQIMKSAIDRNSVECLAICEENGWLKQPRKRDEMIQYASDSGKTECTAWLLDFKNRTADLAAERAKAEKKLERELNADPNSVSELKKLWSYENLDDGSVVITRYKGTRTEIEIPAKIGKRDVTAIGNYAFSPRASRLTHEQRAFRETITKIKLPESIREIGESAFNACFELTEVNIPDGVAEIGNCAFVSCCKITELAVPETVKKMGNGVFTGCKALRSVKLPESITEIGEYMFTNCPNLRKIKLPAAVQSIGRWAFARCTLLEELVIPEGVATIERQAFMNCDSLKTVVIPASVNSMKNYIYRKQAPETVFHNSPNVTAVVEPKSYAEKYCKRNNIKYAYKESADE